MPIRATGELGERLIRLANPTGTGFVVAEHDLPTEPLLPLDEYTQKVVQSRRRGAPYPYELVTQLVAPRAGGRADVTGGSFQELDLDEDGALVPVDRPPGRNTAGIVVGLVTTTTERYPEGMARVALFGDPTKALGSLAEAGCRRIIAALDLAESLGVPAEWFALSAGARIAMDSGTENMDWISVVLRRLIEFTQAGHEVNVVVTGINVGAQPYWNAEATMLMHTKGILVMTPDSAMVLTGKQALDYSGSVSAEDNLGIGGYERIMGPNGQAQYWAADLPGAIAVLLAHYDHTYVAAGERFPRRATTVDPSDRDVRTFPHHLDGSPITTVGDIFSADVNPERKLPFDIRTVMRAVSRPGPRAARAVARPARAATRSWRGTPRSVAGPSPCSASRAGRCAAAGCCRPTAPISGRRGRCSRCRRRRWPGSSTRRAATVRSSCWRTWPASTARPSRCGRCSSSSAPRSAGRSSTSAGRSCSSSSPATMAARSWCSRSASTPTSRRSPSRAPTPR